MSSWLIMLTGLIYLWIGLEQAWLQQWGLSIAYLCYAGANVGLYLLATK